MPKKVLSILLSALMLVLLFAPAAAAADSGSIYPVVYLQGKGDFLYDKDGNTIFPIPKVTTSFIEKKGANLLWKYNYAARVSGFQYAWDDYTNSFIDVMKEVYEDVVPNEDGSVTDGSGANFSWTVESLRVQEPEENDPYGAFGFKYHYDWRLDPLEVAEGLHDFIQDLKEAKGVKKVNLIGRCLGANIGLAYLYKYGASDINMFIDYCGVIKGTDLIGEGFSGKIHVNEAAFNSYIDKNLGGISTANNMLVWAIKRFNGSAMANNVFDKVGPKLIPGILKTGYAYMPSYWSMVNDKYYEEAKSFIFGDETERYSVLIKKIDDYHYNVMNHAEEILTDLVSKGMKIAIVSKYGVSTMPIIEDYDQVSDGTVSVTGSTFGATTSKASESLPADYLNRAAFNGTYRYISADRQIDCSTCLFPQYTWCVRGLRHTEFPAGINRLCKYLFSCSKQPTVFDNNGYTQYLYYDDATDMLTNMPVIPKTTSSASEFSAIYVYLQNVFYIVSRVYHLISRTF